MPQQLSEDRRSQLDGIVSQMQANKETDDDIQAVVNDFKTKYGAPQAAAITPEELATRKAASKATFEANQPRVEMGARAEAWNRIKNLASTALDVTGGTGTALPTDVSDKPSMLSSAIDYVHGLVGHKTAPQAMAAGTQIPLATGQESTGNTALDIAKGAAAGASPTRIVPWAPTAGKNFQQVMSAARNIPVDTSEIEPLVAQAKELSKAGVPLPQVIKDLDTAISDGPVTYKTASDFATTAGNRVRGLARLVNPPDARMEGLTKQIYGALNTARGGAASAAGEGSTFDSAMEEYSAAKRWLAAGKKAGWIGAGAAGLGGIGRGVYSIGQALGYF